MAEPRTNRETVMVYSVDIYVRLALITLFAFFSLKLLAPFIGILTWAIILAVALYPIFVWLSGLMGGKRSLAATLIAVLALILLLTPTILIVDSLIRTVADWDLALRAGTISIPPPAESLRDWPFIGPRLYELWESASANFVATLQQYEPQVRRVAASLVGSGAGLGLGVLQFALSIVFAAVFLAFATPLTASVMRVAARIGSRRGAEMVDMAGATIRNVSRGVVGVALLQGGLGAVGVLVGGVPFAGVISVLLIMLCIVQLPPLGFIPLIIYAWASESSTFAIIFTIYMLACMFIDNVLKPLVMARGLSTPMVVILIGVIGGTISAGMPGLFIGPVVLALFYEMIRIWVASLHDDGGDGEPAPAAGDPAAGNGDSVTR